VKAVAYLNHSVTYHKQIIVFALNLTGQVIESVMGFVVATDYWISIRYPQDRTRTWDLRIAPHDPVLGGWCGSGQVDDDPRILRVVGVADLVLYQLADVG